MVRLLVGIIGAHRKSTVLRGTLVALLLALWIGVPAQSAGLYPLSRQQQSDANGKPLAGAKLYLFNGGGGTPRVGYRDSSLSSAHPTPIVADASGRLPLIYLADGFYRQRLTTATGVQVFDDDGIPVLSTTAGGSGTSVDPDSFFKTGDFKIKYDNQPLSGFVRANGRTIGSPSSGATERANADTQPLYELLWSFANISVTGGKGASAASDFAANKPLLLPNAAGRGLWGSDDLGAGAQNVINSVAGSNVVGAAGGAQARALAQANIPSYTLTGGTATGSISTTGTTGNASADHVHSGSGTTSGQSAAHNHTGSGTTAGMNSSNPHSHSYTQMVLSGTAGGSADFPRYAPGAANTSATDINHDHNFSFTTSANNVDHSHTYSFTTGGMSASHTHNFTGTGTANLTASIGSGGSGAAFNVMPPILTVTIYMRL